MNTQKSKLQTTSNGFATFLAEANKGATLHELSEKLEKLVSAIRETGKPGELKIKLKLMPVAKGDGSSVCVDADTEVKLPKPDRKLTIFFTTEDNQLQRNDPNQGELELQVVEGEKKEETIVLPQSAQN